MNKIILDSQDIKELNATIRSENKKFAIGIMKIVEKYQLFDEMDIENLLNLDYCRSNFDSQYAMLCEVKPGEDVDIIIRDKKSKLRYYKDTFELKDRTFVITSQLYKGEGGHKDNRTPFYNYVLQKVVHNEKIDNEDRKEEKTVNGQDWYPPLDEYDPDISKEQWVDLLNDEDIVGPVWGKWLAMFYSFPEGASCSMVADKFNDNAYSINGIGMNFARKIAEETNCPVMEEDGVKRYWRIPFVGRGTSEGELGTWVYKLRPEIYEALTEVDIMHYLSSTSSSEEKMNPKELLEHITSYINSRGFHYSDEVIKNFYLSLRAKPFVILAGVSGTGKSKIAQLFAEAIRAEFVMIPVRPDWSDSSDLLGYVDLNVKFRAGKLTEALKSANENPESPYFICLDEMNLARVEYYFADMLSLMETDKGKVFEESDFRGDADAFSEYGDVHISDNVYFIGTVNMDETTFPFSRKVLDRANTIEFSEIDFKAGLGAVYGDVEKIKVSNSLLCGEYRSFKKAYADAKDDIDDMIAILEEVNGALEAIGAQVAYRVRDEIASYIATGTSAELLEFTDLMDLCLMQKILPRIQGSSDAVETALEGVKSIADREGYDRSSKKLQFMIDRKKNDGYTSYWL